MKSVIQFDFIINNDVNFVKHFTKERLAFIQEYLSKYCLTVQLLHYSKHNKQYKYEKEVYNEDHNPHHVLFLLTGIQHVGYCAYISAHNDFKVKALKLLLEYEEMAFNMFNKGSYKHNESFNVYKIPDCLLVIKEVIDAIEVGKQKTIR